MTSRRTAESNDSFPVPDWIRIGIQPKMLDPDPYQMNTDTVRNIQYKCLLPSSYGEEAFYGNCKVDEEAQCRVKMLDTDPVSNEYGHCQEYPV